MVEEKAGYVQGKVRTRLSVDVDVDVNVFIAPV